MVAPLISVQHPCWHPQRTGMTPITEDGYIAELNNRLEAHPDFEPGMRFVHYPPGTSGKAAWGFNWEPAGVNHPFVAVATAVAKDFFVQ